MHLSDLTFCHSLILSVLRFIIVTYIHSNFLGVSYDSDSYVNMYSYDNVLSQFLMYI